VPEIHALAVLVVTVAVFYLYTRPWIQMEMVSLLLLASLLLIFYAFPYQSGQTRLSEVEVFQAFGHPALVAICSLMILGRGLTMTGALEPAVRVLARIWARSPAMGLLLTLLLGAFASGFVNDTPVLVLMLPMLLSLAERTGHPAARTLLPVNYAILAGGMLTSIGTSTNLLVLSIAVDLGMAPMGLFDFTSIAAIALMVALPYLWLVAPRLLGDGDLAAQRKPKLRQFDARMHLREGDSTVLGRTRSELGRSLGRDFPVVQVRRDGLYMALADDEPYRVGDVLVLRDTPPGLGELSTALRVLLFDPDIETRYLRDENSPNSPDLHLVELVIGAECPFIGRSIREIRMAEAHHVVAIGFARATEDPQISYLHVAEVPLKAGDVLLVQGTLEHVAALRSIPDLMPLDTSVQLPRSPRAPHALLIMLAVIGLAGTKTLPIHVAAFIGVIAMLLSGCVRLHGVGRALSLQVVLLVASSIALGLALVSTGAAAWIAQGVTVAVQGLSPAMQLAGFMAFSALLTNFVSNSAAAAVGTPIAIATATQLGSPLEPFVLAILFGANLSYATPMAYQTNLLVMNAAKYRFSDFVRVGAPLVVLMLITLSLLLARRYGL
jgi:di/tricarboxylate transporter